MSRYQKIDQDKERKLQQHFEKLDQLDDIQKQQRNAQIDYNIVPSVTQLDTATALKYVELHEKLERVMRRMAYEYGITKQICAKLAVLLNLAIAIADESHPVFADIKETERQLAAFSKQEVVLKSGLLTMKPYNVENLENDPDDDNVSNEPIEQYYGDAEEVGDVSDYSTSDSVISLSALKSHKDDPVQMQPRSFAAKNASLYETERMGKSAEERAREFRLKRQEKQAAAPKKVDFEAIQKLRSEEAAAKPEAPKGVVYVYYREATQKEKTAIRKPADVIMRNKNAIDNGSTKREISKKNLYRKFSKYQDYRNKYYRADRPKRVEGYFGETLIAQKKADEM